MTGYARPATIEEALRVRRDHPDWVLFAGGTDLMVGAVHRPPPPGMIDLFGLPELCGVRMQGGRIHVGAATTYAEIIRSPLACEHLPALVGAAREVGALQIQARGTLGGNVATSSPVGDSLPALLALDACVELGSARGKRVLDYADFVQGYRRTALGADEIILSIQFPTPAPATRQFWRKVGTRRAQAISKVAVAAVARLGDTGAITHARVALAAVAATPVRARQAEAAMLGQRPGAELADRVATALAAEIKPITDVRSTEDYRRRVAANLVARFVRTLA